MIQVAKAKKQHWIEVLKWIEWKYLKKFKIEQRELELPFN